MTTFRAARNHLVIVGGALALTFSTSASAQLPAFGLNAGIGTGSEFRYAAGWTAVRGSAFWERVNGIETGLEVWYVPTWRTMQATVVNYRQPSYVHFSRTDLGLWMATLAARRRFGGPEGMDLILSGGTGAYVAESREVSWTDPPQFPDPFPARTRRLQVTWGVNGGMGFSVQPGGWPFALVMGGRAHLVLGGNDGVLGLITASAGVEIN